MKIKKHRKSALTQRQREVCELLARGLSDKEIAYLLGLTHAGVRKRLEGIFAKLAVEPRSRLRLLVCYLERYYQQSSVALERDSREPEGTK